MARAKSKLTDTFVKSSKLEPGRYSDGGGLYLYVAPGGTKSWVFMWSRDGRRREMGLGAYPAISLAIARDYADRYRSIVAAGGDPITERDRKAVPSFLECAREYIGEAEAGWKNAKHRDQWYMTILGNDREGDIAPPKGREPTPDYCAKLRHKLVSEITSDDVFDVLKPIWFEKHETAKRLRGRIELILDYAKEKKWRFGDNPAVRRGNFETSLKQSKNDQRIHKGHHAALPFEEMMPLMAALRAVEGVSSRALEFTILTAARTGEALGARWDEINFEDEVWSIPGERMKAGKSHRVPLSARAIEILRAMEVTRVSEYVFPGMKPKAPLSQMALAMALRRLKEGVTVHGFRSTFRDWASETTNFPSYVCEQALAHAVGNKVEQAYRRGDVFEKRRKLMDAWARYCEPSAENVVNFGKAKIPA